MTHYDIIARLEEAGRTLLSLPAAQAVGHMRTSTWDYAREAVQSMASGRPARVTPTAAQITRMDEALGWVSWIPESRFVLRRIVGARMMTSPLTGRHFYSWRRIGAELGVDHKAVQRWHDQGIFYIEAFLAAQASTKMPRVPHRAGIRA